MRDHSRHIELKREEAIAKLIEKSHFKPAIETVDLHEALGRVSAVEYRSKYDLPNSLCACMDGIAVRFADFENGAPDTSTWQLGCEYDWANTGTALPEGYDTSIAIERVSFDENGHITIQATPDKPNAGCNVVGSKFHKGDLVLPAHTLLTPARISGLAMCGFANIDVVARPKVAFIPTGDELIEIGNELPLGKAYETNGILLEGKLKLWGADPVLWPCLCDDWDQIKAAIIKATDECDIVTINAGSSKGAKDFTMEILEEIGEVFCHETNHGPGHHTSASMVNGKPVLGLSGPPSGCEITADWYLKPLVDSFLYGDKLEHPALFTTVTAVLDEQLGRGRSGKSTNKADTKSGVGRPSGSNGPIGSGQSKRDRAFFAIRPVRLVAKKDGLHVTPIKGGGHANLFDLDCANGYVCKDPSTLGNYNVGDTIEVELRFPYNA